MPSVRIPSSFAGLRILVVEDTMLVAQTIEMLLLKRECVVVGPYSTVESALAAAESEQDLAGALLDINLNGHLVYPVADELIRRKIPFIFLTGYAATSLPPQFASVPILEKPFSGADFETTFRSTFAAAPA